MRKWLALSTALFIAGLSCVAQAQAPNVRAVIFPPRPAAAGGSVTVDATGTETYFGTAGTSVNYTGLTVLSGNALVAYICFDMNTTAPTGLSAVWDSGVSNQSLSLIQSQMSGANGPGCALLGRAGSVVAGNKTLNISWTNASKVFVVAVSYSGVNPAGGATSFPNAISNVTVATLTVTSAAGHIVTAIGGSAIAITGVTGTSIFTDNTSGTVAINAFANRDAGAASVVIGSSSTNSVLVATDISP